MCIDLVGILLLALGREPATALPFAWLVETLVAGIWVLDALEQQANSLEVHRLEDPPVKASFDILVVFFLDEGGRHGEDRYASILPSSSRQTRLSVCLFERSDHFRRAESVDDWHLQVH